MSTLPIYRQTIHTTLLICVDTKLIMVGRVAKNWTFTIDNHTKRDKARLERLASSVSYLLFKGRKTLRGTNYIEGFVSFEKIKVDKQVRSLLGGSGQLQCLSISQGIHISNCRCCAERMQDAVLKTMKASRWYALYHSPMVGDPPTGGTQKRAPGAPACGAFITTTLTNQS